MTYQQTLARRNSAAVGLVRRFANDAAGCLHMARNESGKTYKIIMTARYHALAHAAKVTANTLGLNSKA